MQIQKLLLDCFTEVASAGNTQVAGPRFQPASRLLPAFSLFLFPLLPPWLPSLFPSFLSLPLFFPSFLPFFSLKIKIAKLLASLLISAHIFGLKKHAMHSLIEELIIFFQGQK